eukprot:SAG11_NODE_9918_length_870_cov_1.075227_1_plen_211_part_01
MEGVVMCDGVIGYERTSFMEVAYSQRNPDDPNIFPETQIKNENRGFLTHLRRGTEPEQSILCTRDVLPPPPPPPVPSKGYSDEGQGYCTSDGKRPESFLCQGGGPCTFTQASCAKLCDADPGCAGFMIQDMSMYKDPPTCNLVTASKPNAPGDWANQNHGNGLAITGHDSEHRDHCWKKQHQAQDGGGHHTGSEAMVAAMPTTTVTLRWTV